MSAVVFDSVTAATIWENFHAPTSRRLLVPPARGCGDKERAYRITAQLEEKQSTSRTLETQSADRRRISRLVFASAEG
jgi:hypothetical protein